MASAGRNGKPPLPGAGRRQQLRPGRLEIPSPVNSTPASSSAPSSLSPLIMPAVSTSTTSNAAADQQRLTSQLITVIGRTPPSSTDNGTNDDGSLQIAPALEEGEAQLNAEDFQDLKRLGEGAGGTVAKVYHIPTGKMMAKKKINVDPAVHIQILRELQFLKTCRSPHIVTYHGAFFEDHGSSIAICMEYCEGGSLENIYKHVCKRQGRIGEVVLGKIGEAVLKGLVYLKSSQGIIHRDIKPSNILVTKKGVIKICDFGVSGKLVQSIAETFTGTSYYMAPERIQGKPYKVSADVWSLGLTIMEVAQNRFPYPSVLSPIELVAHIATMPAPKLSDDYQWSRELQNFLEVCLEKDGEKRPTPEKMLEHPFIQRSMTKKVNLERWIQEVWEWDD